jgi:hypothetical protein
MLISLIRPELDLAPGCIWARYPRVGIIVIHLLGSVERVVAFYKKGGTCKQWIKEDLGAGKWTRLAGSGI